MDAKDGGAPAEVPPVVLDAAAAAADKAPEDGAAGAAATAEGEAPHTPQVSSKHWRKIRSAVVALAAFRSRRVSYLSSREGDPRSYLR